MRFIIMHKTDAHWESGAIPGPELIARIGALLGELTQAGLLQGAQGLRASAEGVRLRFSGGTRTIVNGPFTGENELSSGFSVVRTRSIDEAIEWATQEAAILGPEQLVEIDIRPVTEPWEIGLAPRPAGLDTRRYMVLRKATAATEAGVAPSLGQRARLADSARTGVHLVTETMRPSGRGRRYVNSRDGVSMFDGPFVETKELLAGYIILSAQSLDEAGRWAARYIVAVAAGEVDVRELEL
jgi:hypothetical protein